MNSTDCPLRLLLRSPFSRPRKILRDANSSCSSRCRNCGSNRGCACVSGMVFFTMDEGLPGEPAVATPREKKKAKAIISEDCEAGVLREFPSQWLDKTLEEITEAAKEGDKSAKKAKKLLTDKRFKK